jgi:hypothetical protein
MMALTNNFSLERDDWGRLVLIDADGHRHAGAEAVRAFPISDPLRWISICDSQGHERIWIDDLADLPADTGRILNEYMARREFLPVVERILSVSADTDPSEWHVKTDRGTTRFLLASEDDVKRLGDQAALIVDSFGVRYLVRDVRAMDTGSRRILDRYL